MDSLSDTLRAQIAASCAAQTPYEDMEPAFQRVVSASLYRHALQQHSFLDRARYDPEFHGGPTMGHLGEEDYYTMMIDSLRQSLSLYPHQLADVVAGRLRITPYDYYSSMLVEVIRNENAYDSLPNWTAADCKRVIGVGRNEFINIMNQYRSKSWLSKQRRRTTTALLPAEPCVGEIQPDWRVCGVQVTEEEMLLLDEAVLASLQRLQSAPHQSALVSEIGLKETQLLYLHGLAWLDVPVTLQEKVRILPLHNFVMNKDCTGEDRFEMLLYELLISHDQRSTVEQLAHVLGPSLNLISIPIAGTGAARDMVQRAIGLYLRLGFASKVASEECAPAEDDVDIPSASKRIGLLFDSQLPGALMMGNLSNALKAHAVTLFEAGKLSDESMEPFLNELSALPSQPAAEDPDDASYLYACCLREALLTLRHQPEWTPPGSDGGVDILRIDSLHSLGELRKSRVLAHQYSVLMSLVPLDPTVRPVGPLEDLTHFGPLTRLMSSPWLKLWLYEACAAGPATFVYPRGTMMCTLPRVLAEASSCVVHPWGCDPVVVTKQMLLVHLIEALIAGPVLVCWQGPEAQVVQVHTVVGGEEDEFALPLTDSAGWRSAERYDGLLEVFQILRTKLDISAVLGHIKMARVKSRWVPLALVLGLPVNSLELNSQVLAAAKTNRLLTDRMDDCRDVSLQLASSLERFVERFSGGGEKDTFRWNPGEDGVIDKQLTWPLMQIEFDGERIHVL